MNEHELREAGRKIRLVITDMDGTLLNSQKELTQRTRNMVKALREQGIAFTICTGRIATMVEYYIRELEIDTLVVTTNGAVIWDPLQQSAVYEAPVPPQAAQQLMDFCREQSLDYGALTLGTNYFADHSARIQLFHCYNEIARNGGMREMDLQYFGESHQFMEELNIDKLLIYATDPKKNRMAKEFINQVPGIACTSSDAGLWEVSAEGVSKGSGLKRAAEIMGLSMEQICAFGDYDNDLSMLQEAGLPVAMGNALEHVKTTAAYVTKTNDEDGVAYAVETYVLAPRAEER